MIFKCPGSQNFRQPRPEIVRCPSCGADTEIWSDEIKAECYECGKIFIRESKESCLDWCKYTKECLGNEMYERYTQNKAITIKAKLVKELEEHFGDDKKRIGHAERVVSYAEDILRSEKGDWHIVIPASILHDIGIKVAEEKYGSSAGNYQEKEGPPIARKILLKHGFKKEDINEICDIIAHHHSPGTLNTENFKIVCDADWMVNLKDETNIKDKEKLQKIVKKVFRTKTGKEIAHRLYL